MINTPARVYSRKKIRVIESTVGLYPKNPICRSLAGRRGQAAYPIWQIQTMGRPSLVALLVILLFSFSFLFIFLFIYFYFYFT
jgi:hypothetical protein